MSVIQRPVFNLMQLHKISLATDSLLPKFKGLETVVFCEAALRFSGTYWRQRRISTIAQHFDRRLNKYFPNKAST